MRTSTPSLRSHPEKGAVIVELALVVAPLLLLALGLVEMGLAWRSSLDVSQASRAGVRTVATVANGDQADREALRAVAAGLDGEALDALERVIIFDANAHSTPPASCRTGSSSTCNSFAPAALTRLDDDAAWGCGAGALDSAYCPTTRESYLENPRHVGVQIITQHDWVTGIFPGDGIEIEGSTTMRLPPLLR